MKKLEFRIILNERANIALVQDSWTKSRLMLIKTYV